MQAVITTEDLRKSFRGRKGSVEAVQGVSFEVGRGEIFGFLGPNGAGKTTTLRMLTTLLPIDSGSAIVAGSDVAHQPKQVRQRIGYVSQAGGADDMSTGWENLILQGRLYGGDLDSVRQRAKDLAAVLDLTEFADRKVATYSGGQRRRLDVALGLIHQPDVLFLDEPTTGLDPQARRNFWDLIQSIKARKRTLILTTHYMDEAELLCDEIAIMDRGRIIAQGGPRRLLQEHFEEVLLELPRADFPAGARHLALKIIDSSDRVEIATQDLDATLRSLMDAQVPLRNLRIRPPNLEDLFLELTGKDLRT
jgi:ABC-2 type transport system ATP-binding protein